MKPGLTIRDEMQLTRYLAMTTFERSTTGPMLERAKLYGEAVREAVRVHSADVSELRRVSPRQPSEPWDAIPITAYSRHETRQAAGYTPDDAALTLAGEVGRRLLAMERAGGKDDVAVLSLYYGVVGARYELGSPDMDGEARGEKPSARGQLPKLFALLHVTSAGQALLKSADKLLGRGIDAPDWERMRVHCMLRDRPNYEPLKVLFARAELEAEKLFASACGCWRAAGDGRR
jgi:hypothetical protein